MLGGETAISSDGNGGDDTRGARAGALERTGEEVLERFRWARRRGHPEHLWPDVSADGLRAALGELQRVAAAVLRGDPTTLEPDDTAAIRTLGVAGHVSGTGPLIGYWLETGAVEADDAVRRLFALHLSHGRRRAVRLSVVLREATQALERHGIHQPLVVKGSHTAREYFPEPGTRPALDVDLVVSGSLDRAETALETSGHTLGIRERRPRKSTWLAPGSSRLPRSLELLHAGSQYAVELHGSLERNFFGVRSLGPGPPNEVASRPAPELGAPVRVLRQPELLLYQALHASEGLYHLTLVRVVELVLMIRRDATKGTLQWDAFRDLVGQRRAGRFVFPALAMAERLAPGTIEPATMARLEAAAPARMRRVIRSRSPGRAWRHDMISLDEKFMWCATPLDYVRRAVHMAVLPSSGRWGLRIVEKYRERLFRIVRRTVSVHAPEDHSGDGPASR